MTFQENNRSLCMIPLEFNEKELMEKSVKGRSKGFFCRGFTVPQRALYILPVATVLMEQALHHVCKQKQDHGMVLWCCFIRIPWISRSIVVFSALDVVSEC
jgi:hypothetical protein